MADMIYGNVLKTRASLSFPRTPTYANILVRLGRCAQGPGHNGAQNALRCVVPCVVGFLSTITTAYPPPTTPQRQILTHICVHMRARMHASHIPFLRCAVVPFSFPFENKEKNRGKGHNIAHNKGFFAVKNVVATVVGCLCFWANYLKNNKKGGFNYG